jgi:hypothetical protein
MKTIRPSTWLLALLTFAALLFAFSAYAEGATSDLPPRTSYLSLSWVQFLIPVVVPLLIAGLKKLWPSVPSALLPWLCPLLGVAADQIAKLAGSGGAPAEVAVALGALGLYLREVVDQAKKAIGPNNPSLYPQLLMALSLGASVAFTGCARFSTVQTDTSYDEHDKVIRKITTRAKAGTLFTARSALANFKASQTDKTQGASVGSLTQETSGTNSVAALRELRGIIEALPK